MELVGKVAVVTGGAVRLGRAISLSLAEAGLDVCIHYGHSVEAAYETLQLVEHTGRRGTVISCDFTETEDAGRAVMEPALQAMGRVDVLINSAAIFEPASLLGTTREQFDRHIAVNLRAPCQLAQAFVKSLGPDQHGHIVNILDWRVIRPVPGHFSYTVSKSALWAATRLWAQELAPRVQVNAIAPGAILPPVTASADYAAQLVERVPLKRLGSVAQVTDAILFLLRSDFITGALIPVSGGEEL